MNKKIDRYIILRLFSISIFMLMVLVFIFIIINYSENSEDFADKGATFAEIFGVYYLNYIPEMVRLIIPVAVFVACLYLTGQMADRLEIIAFKAAGISLYRLMIPYMIFAFLLAITVSYLDGFIIPNSNEKRIAFEAKYLQGNSKKLDDHKIFRQESNKNIFKINYFNPDKQTGYQVEVVKFRGDTIYETMDIQKMIWNKDSLNWKLQNIDRRTYNPLGYQQVHIDSVDTSLSMFPRDLARKTSDIQQLTYPEARDYISSIKRSGAGNAEQPKTELYGRYAYPFSIIVVSIIGFALASVRREGGKGFYIAAGLTVSFIYFAALEIIKPFGSKGTIDPIVAAILPHLFFFVLGIGVLLFTRK